MHAPLQAHTVASERVNSAKDTVDSATIDNQPFSIARVWRPRAMREFLKLHRRVFAHP